MKKAFTCIVCPIGCQITVDKGVVSGNQCPRGLGYVESELNNPRRVLTTLVRTLSNDTPVISVKTDKAIPKELIFEVIKEIKKIIVKKSVNIGDILIENVLNTGINVVATKSLEI